MKQAIRREQNFGFGLSTLCGLWLCMSGSMMPGPSSYAPIALIVLGIGLILHAAYRASSHTELFR
jgi:hypothetical protein